MKYLDHIFERGAEAEETAQLQSLAEDRDYFSASDLKQKKLSELP